MSGAGASLAGRVKIALVLDNPKRDLNGLVLVARHLLRRGVETYVVPMYQQGYDIPLIAPSLVLTNYARPQNAELLRTYKDMGSVVCVLDTEGGVLSEAGNDAPENWANAFREQGWSDLVDHYFFWGEALHDAFVRASGMPRNRLHLTGCPRYDLCCPPWNHVLTYNRHGYILVNTNFSAINPKFTGSTHEEIRVFAEGGWDPDYVARLFAELTEVFPRYLDAIAVLARSMPTRTVVVRPHPFEDPSVYSRCFQGLTNVVVEGGGDVLNVIHHAECVVHLNCGTAVETNLLGKDPVSLEFLNSETMRRHAPLPSSVSVAAHDPNDLRLLTENTELRAARLPDRNMRLTRLRAWFYLCDGHASERVADTLIQIAGTSPPARRSYRRVLAGGRIRASLAQRIQGLACMVLGSRFVSGARALFARARLDKRVTPAQIIGRMEDLSAAAGEGVGFRAGFASHPITGAPLSSVRLVSRELNIA